MLLRVFRPGWELDGPKLPRRLIPGKLRGVYLHVVPGRVVLGLFWLRLVLEVPDGDLPSVGGFDKLRRLPRGKIVKRRRGFRVRDLSGRKVRHSRGGSVLELPGGDLPVGAGIVPLLLVRGWFLFDLRGKSLRRMRGGHVPTEHRRFGLHPVRGGGV